MLHHDRKVTVYLPLMIKTAHRVLCHGIGCHNEVMSPFRVLEEQRIGLMKDHPGWRVWYVPNALDGSVTWCAQREPTIHAYSGEDLGKDMALADAELAADRAG